MSSTPQLFRLLPSLYRIRDAERGGTLEALLALVQEQAQHIRDNIDDLYDDMFIETCAEWVVPYIGELVGNEPLHETGFTRRADVAHTLHYRRGKGTPRILEQLARDVTGWSAHVVAFFELLQWTQNVNHLRLQTAKRPSRSTPRDGPHSFERVSTLDVRDYEVLDRFGGPFDSTAHTVDVRTTSQNAGWHNVPNAGFFLWRLEAIRVTGGEAKRSATAPHGFHCSPLGAPLALFHDAISVTSGALAKEANVRGPIRPAAFHLDLVRHAASAHLAYYGPSLKIWRDGNPVPSSEICCMDLGAWAVPPDGRVGVDVTRGRIAFSGTAPAVCTAMYHFGFSAPLGGGGYTRPALPKPANAPAVATVRTIASAPAIANEFTTIGAAVAAVLAGTADDCIVRIVDSRTYVEELTLDLAGKSLTIQAAQSERPAIIGNVTLSSAAPTAKLTLDGLLVSGAIDVRATLAELRIVHSTLVPGRRLDEQGRALDAHLPSIFVDGSGGANGELEIAIERSIVGSIVAPSESGGITAVDSIIDSSADDDTASFVPLLLSGALPSMPALSSPRRQMRVIAGDRAAVTITLDAVPASLPQLAHLLQAALRRQPEPALAFASVFGNPGATSDRLVILAGGHGTRLRFENDGADRTAAELKLDAADTIECAGILGAPRTSVNLDGTAHTFDIRLDGARHGTATAGTIAAATLDAARVALQSAIRAAAAGNVAVANAGVLALHDRLLVFPGAAVAMTLDDTNRDRETLRRFGLDWAAAAIAGNDVGTVVGPKVTLHETTVLGSTHVQAVEEASNCIFTRTVIAARRQHGCIRFSYVPPYSRTPRRYHCQPDLTAGSAAIVPSFTSAHYGHAAYAQLSLTCPREIRTGADDESEMGAFKFLRQPQRETNLRVRLGEYLPFGLDAALIFVT
jgi:hypothetical protein